MSLIKVIKKFKKEGWKYVWFYTYIVAIKYLSNSLLLNQVASLQFAYLGAAAVPNRLCVNLELYYEQRFKTW